MFFSYSAVYSVVCHLLSRGCANWPLVMLEKRFSNLPDDHWLGWSQLKFPGAKKCFAKPKDPIYSDSWYRFPWNIWGVYICTNHVLLDKSTTTLGSSKVVLLLSSTCGCSRTLKRFGDLTVCLSMIYRNHQKPMDNLEYKTLIPISCYFGEEHDLFLWATVSKQKICSFRFINSS